ncbi:MAG: hypothetical protein K2X87_31540 [Gemmataceae bacterium]|nr:hypothetical protein [Gemmataceae bacterium]
MVETPCPGCHRPVKARDDQVGRRVKCSKCRTRFHVPADARNVLLFDDGPRRRRSRRSGLGRQLLAVAVFGLAAGGAVGAVLLYLHLHPPRQQNPTPGPEAAVIQLADPPAAEPSATASGKTPAKPKVAGPAPDTFPNARPVAFQPLRDNPEPFQAPLGAVSLDVPSAAVRRVFPPARPDADPAVLWESRAAFQGVGRRLSLTLFSPQTGQKVGGVEFDAGPTDPVCDLSTDGSRFAAAAGSRVTVWDVKTGARVWDWLDLSADRPADRPQQVVGLTFAAPDRLAVVDAGGRVRVWNVAARTVAGEFALPGPPIGPAPVAATPGRGTVVVVTTAGVFAVRVRDEVAGTRVAGPGPADRLPLVVAVSAGGKVAGVWGTPREKPGWLVVAHRPDGKDVAYQWPGGVGEPVSVGWCGEGVVSVGTSIGAAVWFEAEGDTFRPLAVARVPGDRAIHATAEEHWSLLPGPDGRSVLVGYAMPPQGLVDPLEPGKNRSHPAVWLDARGLFK